MKVFFAFFYSHKVHQTGLNQTLPHVQQWVRSENRTWELWGYPSTEMCCPKTAYL